ncbi:YhgE/Pip domain-containing protein [Sutcliffiella cohnii]|uniref:YhgE/Pip domain-containing protein n=1 Tax=Sutcliffiella cohnii TaxID=33932 RepID=UPI002E1CBC07|nr:YhgE/Pip domain-containing protein [Sutcliffiella cohnii]
MRRKRLLFSILVIMLFLPSFLVEAAPESRSTKSVKAENANGAVASKDEVIYATLNANGKLNEIYVVNILEVLRQGTITDYGNYNSIKNLTDLSEIIQEDDAIVLEAPKGKFYYQGNMDNTNELPWDVTISYFLDGEEMQPSELLGTEGRIKIDISTTANDGVDLAFYENYILQISLVLSPDIFSDIQAPDGMIANAGKNKQVTFTGLPEQKGNFVVEADVVDFEMESIEISAVPYSMAFDVEVDGLTDDIQTLSEAIEDIHHGVSSLHSGVSDLNKGVKSLRDGSTQYQNGVNEISGASSQLVNGSAEINKTLADISSSISNGLGEIDLGDWDVSDLEDVPGSLKQVAQSLNGIADVLDSLAKNYSAALTELDSVMNSIPTYSISEEDIQSLYESGANKEVVDRLVETYRASLAAVENYRNIRESFNENEATLKELRNNLREWSNGLTTLSSELEKALENMDAVDYITQLEQGMATFAASYEEFHKGLVSYTNGVSQLASSYKQIHSGIVGVANGTGELEVGVGELKDGTRKLFEATNDMPEQMREEIDKMMADFDKSDFEAVSFVSADNANINTVQFVIKTEKIKKEEKETVAVVEEEKKGFWNRLLDLFRK